MNELDGSLIKQSLGKDAQIFVDYFKSALENFNHPFKDKAASHCYPMLLFDKHLDDLMKATKNIYSILSDEGKALIKEQLSKISANSCN
jgi:hypothetical protein